MPGKPWSIKEDELCCKAVVDEYVIGKKETRREHFLALVHANKDISKRDKSSIRMRVQNIKALLEELGIPNTLELKPLANAAQQTRACLLKYLEECGITQ